MSTRWKIQLFGTSCPNTSASAPESNRGSFRAKRSVCSLSFAVTLSSPLYVHLSRNCAIDYSPVRLYASRHKKIYIQPRQRLVIKEDTYHEIDQDRRSG